MSAPTPYDRQNSFALFSAENPLVPHSGTSLDSEFNAVKLSLDETQQSLSLIQDDDGVLARGSVGRAQFDASVTIGFGAPSQWVAGKLYTAAIDTVFNASIFYICKVTHTSGVSFDATNWTVIADFTVAAVIADGSITSNKLAAAAVDASKIADGSISNSKIASGAVSTGKIADQNVTTIKIADLNVTTAKLADQSVQVGKIADNNVTYAKMQGVVAARLLGNPTGGTANASEIALGQYLSFSGTTLLAAIPTPTKQIFLAGSGTYVTPAGVKWLRIRMVGGGGGGGGGNSSGSSTVGGATSFSGGSLIAGGGAAAALGVGGPGGSASGGSVANIAGGSGGGGSGAVGSAGGMGGVSVMGGAGGGNGGVTSGVAAAANSGSGGGGGGGGSTANVAAGGGSGAYVEHIIVAPASTYTYAVGTGGAGAAGTTAGNGGAGAAGIIIVEEFY